MLTKASWPAAFANTVAASDWQTASDQILGDEPEQGIDGYMRVLVIRWVHCAMKLFD